MEIRATDIVKITQLSGKRPPDPFPISELSGVFRKPELHELRSILDLQHMMRCIEYMILHWEMQAVSFFYFDKNFMEERLAEKDADWRENLFRALYRVVLAGAVCSRAYNEPFISAIEQNNHSIPNRIRVDLDETITEETVEYLRKFPVYNSDADDMSERGKWRDHEYEAIFGPLAQWLVDDGAARSLRNGVREQDEGFPKNSTLREILHIVAAYEHLTHKIVNGKAGWYLGRPYVNNSGHAKSHSRGKLEWDAEEHKFVGGVRKTTVVLFGVFQLEEILMPDRVEDTLNCFLVANPLNQIEETETSRALWTGTVANASPPANFFDISTFLPEQEPPDPPAVLDLFSFIFRKYFNSQFSNEAFDGMIEDGPIFSLSWPQLFCNGEWGNGIIDNYERPRVYDYEGHF
jgi:hypothetical protein